MRRIFCILTLLAICASVRAQSNSVARPTVCGREDADFRFGVYIRFYSTQIFFDSQVLQDQLSATDDSYNRVEHIRSWTSNLLSVSSLSGKSDMLEIASTAASVQDHAFGIMGLSPPSGRAWPYMKIAMDGGLALTGGAAGVAAYAYDQSFGAINGLFTSIQLNSITKSLNTLTSVGTVLHHYYRNCENVFDTQRAVSVTGVYTGPSDGYLAWLVARHAALGRQSIDESKIPALISTYTSSIPQLATSLRRRETATSNPAIAAVEPRVLVGSEGVQDIIIRGSGFGPNVRLELNDGSPECSPCESVPARLRRDGPTMLRYGIRTSTAAADWSVRVVDGSSRSNVGNFQVRAPEDRTAPGIPRNFLRSPSGWSNRNSFTLSWDEPTDPSGIARFWYRVGRPPTSSTDGTALDAQLHPSLTVEVPQGTEPYVHIWLEDSRGNKDHNNRQSLYMYLDETRPAVTITSPTTGESHSTAAATVTLSGTVSDAESGVTRMLWLTGSGASGTVTMSNGAWTASNIPLNSGANAIGIVAIDGANNLSSAILAVTRTSTGSGSGYTLRTDAENGTISKSPNQAAYTSGTQVTLTASASSGYTFTRWEGDVSGTTNPLSLTMDADKYVSALFTRNIQQGSVSVTILPAEAAAAGARWRIGTSGPWLESGTVEAIAFAGPGSTANIEIYYRDVAGWTAPGRLRFNLPYGQSRAVVSEPYVRPTASTNGHLFTSVGTENDQFGQNVSIHGAYAVIGSNSGNRVSGFVRSDNTWTEQRLMPSGEERTYRSFGKSTYVFHGTDLPQIIVGAPDADYQGAVFVYSFVGGRWVYSNRLAATDPQEDAGFGWSVASDDKLFVAGAPYHDSNGLFTSGAAYIFRRGATAELWTQEQRLLPPEPYGDAYFGHSVAVHDKVIAVAAWNAPDVPSGTGAVYIYRFDDHKWQYETRLVSPLINSQDQFATPVNSAGGPRIAITADRVYVGAPRADPNGVIDAGAVYVFSYDSETKTWGLETTLASKDALPYDFFGTSVSAWKDAVVIGTTGRDDGLNRAGAAYVFRRAAQTWVQSQKVVAPDRQSEDGFGTAVSVSTDALLIGVPGDDIGGTTDRGSAWVFPLAPYNAPPVASTITSPLSGASVSLTGNPSSTVDVNWSIGSDPEGGNVNYVWSLARTASGFTEPLLTSDLTASTTHSVRYRDLAAALDAIGVSLGQTVTLYHRVDVTDGTSMTPGTPVPFIVTRGTFTGVEAEHAAAFALHSVYPNPTTSQVNLRFDLPRASSVSVRVFDLLGREVLSVPAQSFAPGRGHRLTLDCSALGTGIHLALVQLDGTSAPFVTRFMVMR